MQCVAGLPPAGGGYATAITCRARGRRSPSASEVGNGSYNASIELPPVEPAASWSARRLVMVMLQLWRWSIKDRRTDVVLLASEIVTNAVEHAESEINLLLELTQSDGWLRVSLADGSSLRPMVREMDHRRPRGRGMQMVEHVAQRWGVDDVAGGKRVWFETDGEHVDQ